MRTGGASFRMRLFSFSFRGGRSVEFLTWQRVLYTRLVKAHGSMTGSDSLIRSSASRLPNFGKVAGVFCLTAALGFAPGPVVGQNLSASASSAPVGFAMLSAKADAARDANRLDEAASLYKKALAIRPRWAEGWWSLGTIAYDRNSYAEAVCAFQKVISLVPENGNAYVMLGLSEFEIGSDRSALQHLEKGANIGVDKNPQLRQVAIYHEAVLLQRSGRFQEGEDILEQLCLNGVQSDEVTVTLGMVLLRMRNRTPPPPGSPDVDIVVRVGHAGCLAGQKKFAESRNELSTLVSQNSTYPNIHYAFGMTLMEASDLPAADAEFKEEIKNNPADFVSRLQIAAAMYKTNSAAGLRYAEEAVKMVPQQPFAHLLLGLLRLDVDDFQKAIPELEIAEKGLPRESKIYAALGTAYSRAGRRQEAARARATFSRLTQEETKRSAAKNQPATRESRPEHITVGDMPPTSQ
jgi:tetratricopeptide (TPR) repeat protein